MEYYDILEESKHPKLHLFLKENNLVLESAFWGTDLDCAFCIRRPMRKQHDYNLISGKYFYVCFMYSARKQNVFTFDLDTKEMNELEFIEKLKMLMKYEYKYLHFGSKHEIIE